MFFVVNCVTSIKDVKRFQGVSHVMSMNVVQCFSQFPKTGTYFGTHFIMGGERFDTPQPEAYLFGENGDLNFLGSRPTAVSYLDLTQLVYASHHKSYAILLNCVLIFV